MSGGEGRAFLGHAAIYGFGALLLQGASFVLLPLYTHYLEPADYGVLQFLYRLGEAFLVLLMVNGLRMAALNAWGKADSETEKSTIAASLTLLSGIIIAGGTVFAFGLAPTLARLLDLRDVDLLAIGIVATLLKVLTVIPLALMQARIESTRYVMASAAIAGSQVLLTVIALVVLGWGVWGIVIALAVTHTLFGVYLTLQELRSASFHSNAHQLRDMIRFSAPLIPTGVFFFVLHSGDQFFLAHYSGAEVLGLYAFAYRLAQGIALFAAYPLAQVWTASMYTAYRRPDRSVAFGKTITRILGVFTLGGMALILFQRELVTLFASESFWVSNRVMALLVVAQFFVIAGNLLDSGLYVTQRTDLKPWIALVSTLVMLPAYALLIPRYHAAGAAMATVLGFGFNAVATGIVSQRVFRVHLETRRLLGWVAALGVAVALEAALASRVEGELGEWTSLAIRVTLFLAIPWGVWHLGAISNEEKELAVDALRQGGRSVRRLWTSGERDAAKPDQ